MNEYGILITARCRYSRAGATAVEVYNPAGRKNVISSIKYNEFGQMTYKAMANGTATRYNYDVKGRLSGLVTSTDINGETKNIQDVTYSFKVDNSISSVINTPTVDTYCNHDSEIAYSYRYDGLSRLVGATGAYTRDSSFEREYERQYTYSPNGNLTGKTISERTGSPTAPPVEDTWTYTYENHAVKRIDSSSRGSGYHIMGYAAAGNMTTQVMGDGPIAQTTKNMAYDSYNRIKKVTNPDNSDELIGEYWYDDQGFRVKKLAKKDDERNTEVLYPSMYFGLERQKTPEGVIIPDTTYAVNNIYLDGVRIAAVIPSGDAQYYLTDQVDSVKVVVDDDGAPVSRMEYLPYGETWFEEGNTNNAPKYNSQELDKETGYYFYNARHYDPAISRFVTADNVIDGEYDTQGWNRYSYTKGNPVLYKDPSGHLADAAAGAIIGGLVGGASNFIATWIDESEINENVWTSAGIGATIGAAVGASVTPTGVVAAGIITGVGSAVNSVVTDAAIKGEVDKTKAIVSGVLGGALGTISSKITKIADIPKVENFVKNTFKACQSMMHNLPSKFLSKEITNEIDEKNSSKKDNAGMSSQKGIAPVKTNDKNIPNQNKAKPPANNELKNPLLRPDPERNYNNDRGKPEMKIEGVPTTMNIYIQKYIYS